MAWLLYRKTNTWHAWRGTQSLCGLIDVNGLRKQPALAIRPEPPGPEDPEFHTVCALCEGITGRPEHDREYIANEWASKIKIHCKSMHVKLPNEDVEDFADLLSRLGSVRDEEATDAFQHISSLLIHPVRVTKGRYVSGGARKVHVIKGFSDALEKIPPSARKLRQLAMAVRLWHTATGKRVSSERYDIPDVVERILSIPPEGLEDYITRTVNRGFNKMSSTFHPNVIKGDQGMRGANWTGERGTDDMSGVRIIGEEDDT